jgi:sulfite exporter TauE/SafE
MWSTEVVSLAFLASGFMVGFGHCVGMCGPIVVSLSLSLREKKVFIPHLLYHAGRITTYALLGAVVGLTGSFTGVTSRIVGIQKGVMIFAGALIIFMGLAMVGWIPLGRIFTDSCRPVGFLARAFRRLSSAPSRGAYYPAGLVLGLLPCGPVYTALLAAARAGMDAAAEPGHGLFIGAGLMVCFGLGTAPALLIVGKLAGLGWLTRRQMIYRGSAIIMILMGIYFMVRAIRY